MIYWYNEHPFILYLDVPIINICPYLLCHSFYTSFLETFESCKYHDTSATNISVSVS